MIIKTSSKGMEDLNNIVNQLDLSNIPGILHPTTGEYTFYSGPHERLYGTT